jgi:hypothetical protein
VTGHSPREGRARAARSALIIQRMELGIRGNQHSPTGSRFELPASCQQERGSRPNAQPRRVSHPTCRAHIATRQAELRMCTLGLAHGAAACSRPARRTGQSIAVGRSRNSSKLELLLPVPGGCTKSRSRTFGQQAGVGTVPIGQGLRPPANRQSNPQPMTSGRRRKKSASQRSGMSRGPAFVLHQQAGDVGKLKAVTKQGEPSFGLPRTVDDCVATTPTVSASKLVSTA